MLQPSAAPEQAQLESANRQSLQPYGVGEVLPVRLSISDMCRIFAVDGRAMDRSTFHKLERKGLFRRFELPIKIGAKHWSGLRVARYLTGDSLAIEVRRRG